MLLSSSGLHPVPRSRHQVDHLSKLSSKRHLKNFFSKWTWSPGAGQVAEQMGPSPGLWDMPPMNWPSRVLLGNGKLNSKICAVSFQVSQRDVLAVGKRQEKLSVSIPLLRLFHSTEGDLPFSSVYGKPHLHPPPLNFKLLVGEAYTLFFPLSHVVIVHSTVSTLDLFRNSLPCTNHVVNAA